MSMKASHIIKKLCDQFQTGNIPSLLIGGMALFTYGAGRFTTDLDLLISDESVKRAIDLLIKEGFELRHETPLFARFYRKDLALKSIDLIFVDEETFGTMRQDGKKIRLSGVEFIVPSLPHLLALKIHALKNNPDRQKDLPDILGLLKENKMNVKSKEVGGLFEKYGTPELYKLVQDIMER